MSRRSVAQGWLPGVGDSGWDPGGGLGDCQVKKVGQSSRGSVSKDEQEDEQAWCGEPHVV